MERKMHLVQWKMVTKPKKGGGLGIKSMQQLNDASLMKLQWRLITDPNAIWAQILKAKNSREEGLLPLNRHRNPSNAWRGMTKTTEMLHQGISMAIGDGRDTYFWLDNWVEAKSLANFVSRELTS